jgi:hypothetical protein
MKDEHMIQGRTAKQTSVCHILQEHLGKSQALIK